MPLSLLRRKERSPAEEAAIQVEIADQIERQRADRQEAARQQARANQAARRQLWQGQADVAEQRRMESATREAATKRDRKDRQRQQQAKLDQQRMDEFKTADEAAENIKKEIAALRNQPLDYSTPAGVLEAGERAGRIQGLEAALATAEARLRTAGRAIGRHRAGW